MSAALSSTPVLAQTQTVVVPGGSGVVIGPRSQATPRSTLAPPARPQQQRFVVATPQGDPLTGPTAAAAIGLAGAAALAVILGGGSGSGGGSATAATTRTR
ncbi:hypothetical protein [Roseomonas rosulenta]|uniref:hypothetical protein n=1 Tax=Roseomonas rosulenta TaxID=2748667 RepID=UPI0018DF9D8C|nr:hypothetical protein [Roseomonas rosulenta]